MKIDSVKTYSYSQLFTADNTKVSQTPVTKDNKKLSKTIIGGGIAAIAAIGIATFAILKNKKSPAKAVESAVQETKTAVNETVQSVKDKVKLKKVTEPSDNGELPIPEMEKELDRIADSSKVVNKSESASKNMQEEIKPSEQPVQNAEVKPQEEMKPSEQPVQSAEVKPQEEIKPSEQPVQSAEVKPQEEMKPSEQPIQQVDTAASSVQSSDNKIKTEDLKEAVKSDNFIATTEIKPFSYQSVDETKPPFEGVEKLISVDYNNGTGRTYQRFYHKDKIYEVSVYDEKLGDNPEMLKLTRYNFAYENGRLVGVAKQDIDKDGCHWGTYRDGKFEPFPVLVKMKGDKDFHNTNVYTPDALFEIDGRFDPYKL